MKAVVRGLAAKRAVIPDKPGASRAPIRDRRKRRVHASVPDLRAARFVRDDSRSWSYAIALPQRGELARRGGGGQRRRPKDPLSRSATAPPAGEHPRQVCG